VLTITAALNGNTYTSTRMHTRQSWTYGRLDIMAKLPCGQGTWPGIWMMPQNSVYGGWPASGEIDIMELSNKSPNSTKVLGTEHTMQSGGSGTNKSITVTTDCSAFHLYSLNWVPNEMQILVDGTVYNTYPGDFGTIDFANSQQWPFLQAFYLILNVAVGGTLGGTPDASAFPQTMQIDYIRVYQ
jgi:beta-glucanase (GH16 family)